jgi:hypothetical protein
MANAINWGKVYCEMETNSSWGADTLWSTEYIPDFSAPSCWTTYSMTADSILFTADTTLYKADITQT